MTAFFIFFFPDVLFNQPTNLLTCGEALTIVTFRFRCRPACTRGIDVLTISDAGKLGASDDEEHFVFARQHQRAIVTHDTDFLRLAGATSDHAGVVYAPQERSIGEMVHKLSFIARVITQEEMRGHVEYIGPPAF